MLVARPLAERTRIRTPSPSGDTLKMRGFDRRWDEFSKISGADTLGNGGEEGKLRIRPKKPLIYWVFRTRLLAFFINNFIRPAQGNPASCRADARRKLRSASITGRIKLLMKKAIRASGSNPQSQRNGLQFMINISLEISCQFL